MVVVVVATSSSSLLRPFSAVLRRSTLRHHLGKVGHYPFKLRTFVSSMGKDVAEEHVRLEPLFIPEVTSGVGDTDLDSLTNVKSLVVHQVMACRRLPAVVLVGSALMLNTPLKVLAETCEADRSLFNMPLFLFVALIGATVGGLVARQRKGELQRVNEQLRQINAALRRQAKIESYAPSLSYAPVGSKISENEVIVDPRKAELISHLRSGKNYLRNHDPEKAFSEFEAALKLSQSLNDSTDQEKKAARGLGASLQRLKKYREAIEYHNMVLKISEREGEDSGNTEAYGAIADCYTELGELERAGKFYDKYIALLETD